MADAQIAPSLEERRLALEERKAEREHEVRMAEVSLKRAEGGWATRLFSPLTTTLFAGILTLAASAVGTLLQGRNTLELERNKFDLSRQLDIQRQQHELILKMISVGDEKQARANIEFLADTGLISDRALAERLLASKSTGVLPSTSSGARLNARPNAAIRTDDDVIDLIVTWEGGLVDIPGDPAGPTNAGIGLQALSEHLGKEATAEELRALTPAAIKDFYRRKMSQTRATDLRAVQVRAAYFNIVVQSGATRAGRALQLASSRVLGRELVADGMLGPMSLSLINEAPDPDLLAETANCLHLEWLKTLDAYANFGRGWVQRVRAFSPAESKGVCADLAAARDAAVATGR